MADMPVELCGLRQQYWLGTADKPQRCSLHVGLCCLTYYGGKNEKGLLAAFAAPFIWQLIKDE